MMAKFFIFLLVMALVFMTFKFLREREARMRERIDGKTSRETAARRRKDEKDAVTLRKDPKTGVYEPSDD